MNPWLALGSLAGVLGLAGLAAWLGLGGASLADEDEAKAIAEAELPGFIAARAEVAPDGEAATVTGVNGERVRLRRHGAQFVAELIPSPLREEGDSAPVERGERAQCGSADTAPSHPDAIRASGPLLAGERYGSAEERV